MALERARQVAAPPVEVRTESPLAGEDASASSRLKTPSGSGAAVVAARRREDGDSALQGVQESEDFVPELLTPQTTSGRRSRSLFGWRRRREDEVPGSATPRRRSKTPGTMTTLREEAEGSEERPRGGAETQDDAGSRRFLWRGAPRERSTEAVASPEEGQRTHEGRPKDKDSLLPAFFRRASRDRPRVPRHAGDSPPTDGIATSPSEGQGTEVCSPSEDASSKAATGGTGSALPFFFRTPWSAKREASLTPSGNRPDSPREEGEQLMPLPGTADGQEASRSPMSPSSDALFGHNESEVESETKPSEDDLPDEEKAALQWERYRAQNRSLIGDIFEGQLRSHLRCSCGHHSSTFEPSRYLSVPIPSNHMDRCELKVVFFPALASATDRPQLQRYTVAVPKSSTAKRLQLTLARKLPVSSVLLAEVYRSRIHRYLEPNLPLSDVRADDELVAFEVQQNVEDLLDFQRKLMGIQQPQDTIWNLDGCVLYRHRLTKGLVSDAEAAHGGRSILGLTLVGYAYLDGLSIPADATRAVEILQDTAHKGPLSSLPDKIGMLRGNAAAKCSLSYCFDSGLGVKADKTKATELLEESAAQGYATALFKLGCWHQYGRGGKVVNPDRAFELFNEAAKQGYPAAMNQLGLSFANGRGVAVDPAAAFSWYQRASDAGDADGTYHLALCYRDACGLPPGASTVLAERQVKTVELYQKSADLGQPQALFNLGCCFMNGTGVSRDAHKAVECYQKAIALGDMDAHVNMAKCLMTGEGVEANSAEAQRLLMVAADHGHPTGLSFAHFHKADSLDKTEVLLIQVMHRHVVDVCRPDGDTWAQRREVFGMPFVVSAASTWSYATLHEMLMIHAGRYLKPGGSSSSESQVPFVARIVNASGTTCGACDRKNCTGCLLPKGHARLRLRAGLFASGTAKIYVALDWVDSSLYHKEAYIDSIQDEVGAEATAEEAATDAEASKLVPLSACIDAFAEAEELKVDNGNGVKCDKCKVAVDATKKMDIWREPDVLVLHIKRFHFSGEHFEKISTPVQVPLRELDVRSWIGGPTGGSCTAYDLYGVVCHLGGMSGGHYTSYCMNEGGKEPKWFKFNDDSVSIVDLEQELPEISKQCYVLFYRKQAFSSSNLINYSSL
eukprot:symbB.v1.2.010786.t3/scaffold707.1/size170859/7